VPFPWNSLGWTIDGSTSTSGVTATLQLYNYVTDQYPIMGDGFMLYKPFAGDTTKLQQSLQTPQIISTVADTGRQISPQLRQLQPFYLKPRFYAVQPRRPELCH
jgi:hypothetical protein